MDRLRIIFMGTPEFAVQTLEALVDSQYEITGVVTAPDKPAGRGRLVRESAVKTFAVQQGLKVLQPSNLRDQAFLKALRALNGNLQIVVAFRMLPRMVWQLPEYGTFNLHASLLPDYRGAAPINWAIMNGEEKTGVTTFLIDEKIDTGAIILQKEIAIAPDETAGMLHDRLMVAGAELVMETVGLFEKGRPAVKEQEAGEMHKPAPKIHPETCVIDWKQPLRAIYNHIRGLSPYPAARTTLYNGEQMVQVRIFRASLEKAAHGQGPGRIRVAHNKVKITAKEGFLVLHEIQLEGRRRLKAPEVFRGLRLEDSAYMA